MTKKKQPVKAREINVRNNSNLSTTISTIQTSGWVCVWVWRDGHSTDPLDTNNHRQIAGGLGNDSPIPISVWASVCSQCARSLGVPLRCGHFTMPHEPRQSRQRVRRPANPPGRGTGWRNIQYRYCLGSKFFLFEPFTSQGFR